MQRAKLAHAVQEPLREGWLCFQRTEGGERYRLPLSDAPPVWEDLPPERLDLLRRVALLSPTTGPMRQVPSPERQTEDEARARIPDDRPAVGADD